MPVKMITDAALCNAVVSVVEATLGECQIWLHV